MDEGQGLVLDAQLLRGTPEKPGAFSAGCPNPVNTPRHPGGGGVGEMEDLAGPF